MTTENRISEHEKRRRARETKRQLRLLTDYVLCYVAGIDAAIAGRKDIPRDVSEWLGKNVHALEFANDAARYHGLLIDFRKDDKKKAVHDAARRISEGK